MTAFLSRAAVAAGLALLPCIALAQTPPADAPKADAPKPDAAKADAAGAKLLATVNGQQITEEDLRVAREDLAANLPPQLQGKARDAYLLDFLIDGALVAQLAKSEGLDKTPEYARRLAYYHEKLLMEAKLGQIAKAALTDEAIKKTYDDALKAQKPEQEVRARHILVATDDDAKKVIARLKAGEDFAKVAKEVSKDTSADGGELGWFSKDKMVPEFADAAFKLDVGQMSEPVKSPFGWHVIEVEGKREKPFPALDEVKDQVSRYVVQKAQSDAVTSLRKNAKIERAPGAPSASDETQVDDAAAAAPAPAPAPAEEKKK
ncbi:peptidylprolyl isomerase [Methylocella sp.]|uniref:peptidylprolyl isomerase n=1 Tax=Methylocella sp. TaxID=1978226 RepID=UPI0035B47BA1